MFNKFFPVRTIICMLCIQISCVAIGQEKYTEVVAVDSATADHLYSRAKIFVTNAFVSGKEVTELTDDQGKTIITKGNFSVRPHGMGSAQSYVKFRLSIASKDRRYRYSFSDIIFVYQAGSVTKVNEADINEVEAKGVTKKQWTNVQDQVKETISKLIGDLKKQMEVKDDW